MGDLVWANGHPRDGIQRFVALVVREPNKQPLSSQSTYYTHNTYLVYGFVTQNRYHFHASELEIINESR